MPELLLISPGSCADTIFLLVPGTMLVAEVLGLLFLVVGQVWVASYGGDFVVGKWVWVSFTFVDETMCYSYCNYMCCCYYCGGFGSCCTVVGIVVSVVGY